MKIVEYIQKHRLEHGTKRGLVVPHVRCADGFSVSCQASSFHYCTPRVDYADWTHIELGYPSAKPTMKIRAYAENRRNLLGTVYGQVPVELVDAMLEKHGGIVQ